MRYPQNRMSRHAAREQAAERVVVQPPPESVLKCPHCGAARINGMRVPGSHPLGAGHRRVCRSCGTNLLFGLDFKTVRIIG